MTRLLPLLVLVLAATAPAQASATRDAEPIDDFALAAARCIRCHEAPPALTARLAALPSPDLAVAGDRFARPWLDEYLALHGRLTQREAGDVAAVLSAARRPDAAPLRIGAGEIARGETLWRAHACAICHAQDGIPSLAGKTWVGAVRDFLVAPQTHRPDLGNHAFALSHSEAQALAAYLLRATLPDTQALEPGLLVECFEVAIDSPREPDLEGLIPARTGHAQQLDLAMRSRDDDFALRFSGFLNVPTAGEWTFVVGSDDSSWLWLDEQLVVRNEAIAPYRKVRGKVTLTAGWHPIRVLMTEARGGEALDVGWRGPGVELQALPADALATRFVECPAPPPAPPLDSAARARGEALVAARCAACHVADAPPTAKRAWQELPRAGTCALVAVPADFAGRIGVVPTGARSAAAELTFHLQRDGCVRCHAHAGLGGVPAAARTSLVEREDLGEEARVPPDLTHAGARLQPAWIEKVLRGEVRARPYLTVRKPHLGAEDAARWTELLVRGDAGARTLDALPVVDDVHVAEGRRLAGTTGLACIACHSVAGRRSLGPQGMDLAQQAERLRPDWMRAWLLAPNQHRPGTRMPTYFPPGTRDARDKVEALVAWLSLGRSIPLPLGLVTDASAWRLDATDRPRLHGAFLDGLSARCIAVTTPERVNYAYDLAHARFAWLWRGEFLDTSGTWEGRAGRLLTPLGDDHVVLAADGGLRADSGDASVARSLGWRLDDDGHPVFRVQIGRVIAEDALRPRLAAGGAHVVRRITARFGTLRFEPGKLPAGLVLEPAGAFTIGDGETKEVIYRW